MTTTFATPNILKKDHDGEWYSIPESMTDHFIQMVEEVQNSDFMSDAWLQAIDDFNTQFQSYKRE